MSVKDRIDDSRLLFAAGRLGGAFLMVLTAVAGTSRKRYPKEKMGSSEAFERFLEEERPKYLGNHVVRIEFEGETYSLEQFLWKFLRCELAHEAELRDKVSVDYGDFLLDKRGTHDHFTFSSQLMIRLAYVVETAPENTGVFPESRYDRLPEPIDLRRAAIIRFAWGDQRHECVAYACSLVAEVWEQTGEVIDWIHLKGHQLINGRVVTEKPLTMLVPAKYVTGIEDGPEFDLAKRRTSVDVGVFPPDKPTPPNAMDVAMLREDIAGRQIALVHSIIQMRRPFYEVEQPSVSPLKQPDSAPV